MTVLDAPALAGSRNRAREVLANVEADLTGVEVVLRARGILAASVSFIDELVFEVLVQRHAAVLKVVGATDPELVGYLKSRATEHGVLDKLQFAS